MTERELERSMGIPPKVPFWARTRSERSVLKSVHLWTRWPREDARPAGCDALFHPLCVDRSEPLYLHELIEMETLDDGLPAVEGPFCIDCRRIGGR